MALFVPQGADFQWQYSLNSATRPTTTGFGTLVTAGATANTMGTWTQVVSGANMLNEGYGISIAFTNNFASATTRNMLVDVGIDTAGGTNYTTKIPFLVAGHANTYALGGIFYYFPLYIPAGASVAVRAQGTVASSTVSANVTVFGQPRRPDAVRCGSKVFAFGTTSATSSGTVLTLGTTAEGAWTQVGTAATQSLWWWQLGYTCIDTTMTASAIHFDIGSGTAAAKKILMENILVTTTATEQVNIMPHIDRAYGNTTAGDLIYVRGQSAATADTSPGVIVYGLGG